MLTVYFSRILILIFGILLPAYNSYKALQNRDAKQQIKMLMHWIVFATYTASESILDIFVPWFPFYYEIKILFLFWLVSPYTKGTIIFYRKIIHPNLVIKEKNIERFIEKIQEKGYIVFMELFQMGYNYFSNVIIQSTSVFSQALLVNLAKMHQNKSSYLKNTNNSLLIESDEEIEPQEQKKILKIKSKKIITEKNYDMKENEKNKEYIFDDSKLESAEVANKE